MEYEAMLKFKNLRTCKTGQVYSRMIIRDPKANESERLTTEDMVIHNCAGKHKLTAATNKTRISSQK